MSRSMFTRLPFSVADSSLPVIPSSDISTYVDVEFGSYEHWSFGVNASSLIGLNNQRSLTVQSVAPSYVSNYVSVSGDSGKGLLSPLGEVAGQVDTLAAIVRLQTSASGGLTPFGSLSPSAAAVGGAVYLTTGSSVLNATYRGTTISTVSTGRSLPTNTWLFLAVARNFSGTSKRLRVLVGGSTVFETTGSNAYAPIVSPNTIALGNGYYSGSSGSVWNFAEFVMFNEELSATDLSALYTRAKARAAKKGITVV